MNIALFGKGYTSDHKPYIQMLVNELAKRNAKISFYHPYFEKISNDIDFPVPVEQFQTHKDLVKKTDLLFSIGGDGTLLDTVPFVRGSGIPILGINLGRMGFLSSISKDEIVEAVKNIFNKNYKIRSKFDVVFLYKFLKLMKIKLCEKSLLRIYNSVVIPK